MHLRLISIPAALAVVGIGVVLFLREGSEPSEAAGGDDVGKAGGGGSMRSASLSTEVARVSPKSGERPARDATPRPVTTPSGLRYEVLREGDGPRPGPTDTVEVNYRGTTTDGKEFDSTYDRFPAQFRLDGVIKGWGEGVQLMKVGSKFRFVIPPELAYGKAGYPGKISPNETLIFEIELLGIEESVAQ